MTTKPKAPERPPLERWSKVRSDDAGRCAKFALHIDAALVAERERSAKLVRLVEDAADAIQTTTSRSTGSKSVSRFKVGDELRRRLAAIMKEGADG